MTSEEVNLGSLSGYQLGYKCLSLIKADKTYKAHRLLIQYKKEYPGYTNLVIKLAEGIINYYKNGFDYDYYILNSLFLLESIDPEELSSIDETLLIELYTYLSFGYQRLGYPDDSKKYEKLLQDIL